MADRYFATGASGDSVRQCRTATWSDREAASEGDSLGDRGRREWTAGARDEARVGAFNPRPVRGSGRGVFLQAVGRRAAKAGRAEPGSARVERDAGDGGRVRPDRHST